MSATINNVSQGTLTVDVAGTLAESDVAVVQQATADVIRAHGTVRILVLAKGFTGWERGGAWDDFSFQEQYDPHIEKMAIVGDKQWEDLALIFTGKDLRTFPIEYFTPDALDDAQSWLGSDSEHDLTG